ncbi:MAG: YeeE/YedE family protein [Proteobacteria bacterium]|nr:YeeE/YedE family protein [Pseudomonadota bacterium]
MKRAAHHDAGACSRVREQAGDEGLSPWPTLAAAALAGLVFGAGLVVSQMSDPRKVLNFLDLLGPWDASLLFVLGSAVPVAAAGFALLLRRRRAPWLAPAFEPPAAPRLDAPLLLGSALFGVGWGLVGYCPGPAVAALGLLNPEALWFVPAMLAGAALQRGGARRGG